MIVLTFQSAVLFPQHVLMKSELSVLLNSVFIFEEVAFLDGWPVDLSYRTLRKSPPKDR